MRIPWLAVAMSFIPGIVLGVNWRWMGRRNWSGNIVAAFIFIPAIIAGCALAVYFCSRALIVPGIYGGLAAGGGFFGLNFTLLSGVTFLQWAAHSRWRNTGSIRTMLEYRYDFSIFLLTGLLVPIFAVLAVTQFADGLVPKSFYNSYLDISYPYYVEPASCEEKVLYNCSFARGFDGYGNRDLYIAFSTASNAAHQSLEEMEAVSQHSYEWALGTPVLVNTTNTTIDGHPALIRDSSYPSSFEYFSLCQTFQREIYISDDNITYYIDIEWGCTMADYLPEVDGITSHIAFKQEST
jgi:hypothetical protein